MYKSLLSSLVLLAAMPAWGAERAVTSPDGRLVVTVADEGGRPPIVWTMAAGPCCSRRPWA